jgi:hypothetical protein
MLVREVLELTLQPEMNIQQLAKHIDGLGKKRLCKALAQAGCVPLWKWKERVALSRGYSRESG